MAVLRLDEIARIAGGIILQGSPALSFGSCGIDSRLTTPGSLFFAVPGRRDGHDFVADAAKNGAAGAIVRRPIDRSRSGLRDRPGPGHGGRPPGLGP